MSIDVEHFDLTGRKAAVLGAETPAGSAIARAYAEAGADLALCVPASDDAARALAKEVQALGATCELLASDVSSASGAGEAVRQAARVLGGLDVLASAPDLFLAKPIGEITDEELARVVRVNFGAQFGAVRAAVGEIRESGAGNIVLVTHVLGSRGLPNTSAYSAAAAATQNLIRALAQELAPEKISINGIALGWMDWMTDRLDPEQEEGARAMRFTILKRAGRADDVGPMAVWLSGSGVGYVTGQIFALDGGLTQHL